MKNSKEIKNINSRIKFNHISKNIIKKKTKKKSQNKKYDLDQDSSSPQTLEFKKILKILECNNNNRISQIIYKSSFENFYKKTIKYSCNNANCNICKQNKLFAYVKDRFLNSKTIYFITVSTPFEIQDKKETELFRKQISNFFDFMKTPYIATFEIGEKGNKIHSHIAVFNPKKSSVFYTDYLKLYTGFVTNGKIINNKGNDKIKNYISKINKYMSKIEKQNMSIENNLEVSKEISHILKNWDYNRIKKIIKTNKSPKDYKDFDRYMNILEKNIKYSKDKRDSTYYLLAMLWNINRKPYLRVLELLKNKYYYKDYPKYIYKKNNFQKKQIKIMLNKEKRYLDLLKDLQENSTFSINTITNKIFITSIFPKRVASNISIVNKNKVEKIKTQKFYKEYLEFYFHKSNKEKPINIKKHIDTESLTTINYTINNRKYRLNSLIANGIIKNTILKKNNVIHLLSDQQKIILAFNIKVYLENKYEKSKNIFKKNNNIKTENEYKHFKKEKIKIDLLEIQEKYEKIYTNKDTKIKTLPL